MRRALPGIALLLAGPMSLAAPVTVTGGGYFSQSRQGEKIVGLTLGVTVSHHAPGPVRVALTLAERRAGCTPTTKPAVTLTASGTASRSGRAPLFVEANAAQLAPLNAKGPLCVVAVQVDSRLLTTPPGGWNLLPALLGE